MRLDYEVLFAGWGVAQHEAVTTWLDLPPGPQQTRWAIAVTVLVLAGFVAVLPVASQPMVELNSFFPSLDAIVLVSDLVTAVLLYTQFSISRSRALLALATGYLFTALIVVPHALTFDHAFSQSGLLGANIQTGSWLFIFWHIGFAAALLAYALLREQRVAEAAIQMRTGVAIAWSIALVVVTVCVATWFATAGATLLPPIILDQRRISRIVIYPISFAILVSVAAMLLLLPRRRNSLLDLWLAVVALVAILELAFSGLIPSVRFSAGFYAGRLFSLMTASIVLIVLLAETARLHVRLAHANARLSSEQDSKMMNLHVMASSIVHEMRQPLSGASTYSGATAQWLKRSPPDIGRALEANARALDAIERADEVLQGVRALFAGHEALPKDPVDINDLVDHMARLQNPELDGLEVHLSLDAALPPVLGNKGQLQQLVANLITNAREAMAATNGRRILRITTEPAGDGAAILIEDSGPGISPEIRDKMFDAFVSSKANGMGLGLAICRLILDRHQGGLSVSAAKPHGTIFKVTLPRETRPGVSIH